MTQPNLMTEDGRIDKNRKEKAGYTHRLVIFSST
jgi:hypothetical protein